MNVPFLNSITNPAYYNDFDEGSVEWLKLLIAQGVIAPGEVDGRSILDVTPDDVRGFTQCHFFAGIGGWSFALRNADWPDDRPVWTGSPPCQPFSTAGRQEGRNDERHLAPQFAHLIRACKPPILFGEQVASAAVFGKVGNKNVHPLWRREEQLRFLEDSIKWELTQRLSGVSECGCSGASCCSSGDASSPCGSNGLVSEKSSIETGRPVRSDSGVHREETCRREVRGHRNSLLDDIEEGVGFTIDGSGDSGEWVHAAECENGPIFGEHGLLRLGRGTGKVYSTCDLENAYREVQRAIEENRRDIEGSDSWSWIDALHSDLERASYTIGAVDIPSAGIGAPHIRQRTFFGAVLRGWLQDAASGGMVDSERARLEGHGGNGDRGCEPGWFDSLTDGSVGATSPTGRMGNTNLGRGEREPGSDTREESGLWCRNDADAIGASSTPHGLADSAGERRIPGSQRAIYRGEEGAGSRDGEPERHCATERLVERSRNDERPSPTNGFWRDADWLFCRDGKWRPVEPGLEPLAYGLPTRVGLLRGYGNAINPWAAEAYIKTFETALKAIVEEMRAAQSAHSHSSLDGLIV